MAEINYPKSIRVSKNTHKELDGLIGFKGCRYVDDVIQMLLKKKR